MTSLLLLTLWIGTGLALAVRTAQPGEPKLAWAPIAVILGPLWAPVAFDRRMIADDEREGLRRR